MSAFTQEVLVGLVLGVMVGFFLAAILTMNRERTP